MNSETIHTLAVLVENRPGVLARISGLLSRRAFNIESIAAGPTEEPDVTRITLVVRGNEDTLGQVTSQLGKLVDVIKIADMTSGNCVHRELALIKVAAPEERRRSIIDIVEIFRAKIVDVHKEALVIEMSGEETKIDALLDILKDYGIIELARTGRITLGRGPVPAKAST
ncbi:MAG TPA: acetolactate synthase small subunit [Clostridia bacterium]|nr:acetolactate synthase small subunit [Clostridia bacterium]